MARRSKAHQPIHPSVRDALGYADTESDAAVVGDWEERKRRVCKPCWELKYCPYGPLIEQSPMLPPRRQEKIEHVQYLKACLEYGSVGELHQISEEEAADYRGWLDDDEILLAQAVTEFRQKRDLDQASQMGSEAEQVNAWLRIGPLPPIHIYRAPFDWTQGEIREDDFSPDEWEEINTIAKANKEKYICAAESGVIDNRHPLEPVRATWFRMAVDRFEPDDYPEEISRTFLEAECNIFGHICPVFFAGQATTETKQPRRRGRRQLSFATMMRIVRRDDYRCQHCGKNLKDDEVEFDHVIPISKGGSSEEYNIRLTCFDCNRDKGDDYEP